MFLSRQFGGLSFIRSTNTECLPLNRREESQFPHAVYIFLGGKDNKQILKYKYLSDKFVLQKQIKQRGSGECKALWVEVTIFKKCFIDFWREGNRNIDEREASAPICCLLHDPTGDGAHNPGLCPKPGIKPVTDGVLVHGLMLSHWAILAG